jgi:predicted esterase
MRPLEDLLDRFDPPAHLDDLKKKRVMMLFGKDDNLVPRGASIKVIEVLASESQAAGGCFEEKTYETGHKVTPEMVPDAAEFFFKAM